ncbi:3-hydroxyisobutyrate dehydrogenase [Cohaesibacter sp. ES.047]|uniref:NAD(P)-dependent oxidoreductase n=1 Tax=Cohaesibacter sp. ES.047 TaxID=1798205 RepID=UPI000BB8AFDE|nr:NAD(P)-dependent oxidoreductase [Cohaesibacter sp. ES.047]SNY93143.1 3-hydroxyisobutyrate dehydrogenase [Cohaesibacter sp. ES.047]
MHGSDAIGFIGLGTMGTPIALRLAETGVPLVIWNRTSSRTDPLREAGAVIAAIAEDVFAQCQTILLMLADEVAIDAVLSRNTDGFASLVANKLVVSMGTVSADYSESLSVDISLARGRYVEAPVSGSKKPAQLGQLVSLLAGNDEETKVVRQLLQPCCKDVFECGQIPKALQMKFAVNSYLINMVTGLAEAWNLAEQNGLDTALFTNILNAGPMASDVSRTKLAKLCTGDMSRQAGIQDVWKNCQLVMESASSVEAPSPLMKVCSSLYREAVEMGLEKEDMISVGKALKKRKNIAGSKM